MLGDRYPCHGKGFVELRHGYEVMHFTYNVCNGQAAYLLACNQKSYHKHIKPLKETSFTVNGQTHPFAVHLILLSQIINTQGMDNDRCLRRLMMLEELYLRGDSKVTYESPDDTKHRLQVLHGLLLHLIMSANKNKKYSSFIDHLLRDLDRIQNLHKTVPEAKKIDTYSHQRLVDAFNSLQGYCQNRGNRLASRKERVQNLIDLVRCQPGY